MEEDQERISARAAAVARFDQASKALAASGGGGRFGAEIDLVGRMMFGIPGCELSEDQEGQALAWVCKDRPVERLQRGAVRDAAIGLGRLAVLHARVDDRLDRRSQRTDYLDMVTEAHADGTVVGMLAICDGLEASWHDARLTRDEGIEAVEAVEALRLALRRMEACGLSALTDFEASNGLSRPAMP